MVTARATQIDRYRSASRTPPLMEFLAIAWIVGLVAYFKLTTERQRENILLVTWGLMLLPVIYYLIRLALQ